MMHAGSLKAAMAEPLGLYGHVRANHLRSLALFAGFILAFQIMAGAVMMTPLLMFDTAHAPIVSWAGYGTRYLLPVTLAGIILFGVAYWWHVSAVRRDTGFRYVDHEDEPRLCRLLEPLIIAAGIQTPYVAVIDSPALNAFACGVRDSHTVVVVTRGLIDGLDDEELEAVLAHELIHIRNRDTRLMAAANAFIANLTWLRSQSSKAHIDNWRNAIGIIVFPLLLPVVLLINFLAQTAFRIGYVSRAMIGSSREFIADAEAVRLTQNPAALISALNKVDGREAIEDFADSHDAMLIAGAVEGPTATHPTIAQRIAALVQVTGPAAFHAPIRRDTRAAEQRRPAGFGRRLGHQLSASIAIAERPGIRAIFRLTRDPERNIFGLNRRGMVVVLLASLMFLVFYRGMFTRSYAAFADRDAAEQLNEIARDGVKCQLQGMAALFGIPVMGKECSEAILEGKMKAVSEKMGIPFADPTGPFTAFTRTQVQKTCFHRSLHDWPGPPPLPLDHVGEGVQSMDFYRSFALDGIEGADKGAEQYIGTRMLLLDHVYYYFGRAGLSEFNKSLDTPFHHAALQRFGIRLRDPAYVSAYKKRVGENDLVAAQVLLAHPFEIKPCDAVRAEDSRRGFSQLERTETVDERFVPVMKPSP